MRVVIGDIHGELQKLKDLLKLVCDSSEFIFIGDYVDKGNNSYEVVDFLIDFSKGHNCVFLIGNHEFVWLRYLFNKEYFRKDFLLAHGSIAFASSYLKKTITLKEFSEILEEPDELIKAIPEKHLNFLKKLLPYYIPKGTNYLCVHAGVDPDYESGDIENHPLEKYLFSRKKFIYNNKLFFGKKVIFGHTACKYPYLDQYKIGIDTGATYKEYGLLTAYDIDSGDFIQHDGIIMRQNEVLEKNKSINPFDEVFNVI